MDPSVRLVTYYSQLSLSEIERNIKEKVLFLNDQKKKKKKKIILDVRTLISVVGTKSNLRCSLIS